MSNSYVSDSYKSRLRSAARRGRDAKTEGACNAGYACSQLDQHS